MASQSRFGYLMQIHHQKGTRSFFPIFPDAQQAEIHPPATRFGIKFTDFLHKTKILLVSSLRRTSKESSHRFKDGRKPGIQGTIVG